MRMKPGDSPISNGSNLTQMDPQLHLKSVLSLYIMRGENV